MRRSPVELVLTSALFFDLLGFGMVLADFQLRAEALMPAGMPTGLVIGAILASTFVVQIIVSPRWGVLSDRVGRKPVLVACALLSAVAMLLYGAAGSLGLLLVSRIVAGLGGANVSVAQAFAADVVPAEKLGITLGRLGMGISGGLILGPALGGFLAAEGSNRLVGWVGGGASLLGALLIMVALPSVRPVVSRENKTVRRPSLDLLRQVPGLRRLALIAAVSWFSLAMLEGTFARLIHQLYGYDQREFGMLFGYEALLGAVVQGLLLATFRKWVTDGPLLRTALVLQGLGLVLNPLAGVGSPVVAPIVLLGIASTLFAVGSGVANPTLNAACSAATSKERQGELFGVLQAARSVGFIVGPLAGGMLFDWQPWSPYVIAFAASVVAALLVPRQLPSARETSYA